MADALDTLSQLLKSIGIGSDASPSAPPPPASTGNGPPLLPPVPTGGAPAQADMPMLPAVSPNSPSLLNLISGPNGAAGAGGFSPPPGNLIRGPGPQPSNGDFKNLLDTISGGSAAKPTDAPLSVLAAAGAPPQPGAPAAGQSHSDVLAALNAPLLANDHSTRNKWAGALSHLGALGAVAGSALYSDPKAAYTMALGRRIEQAQQAGITDPHMLMEPFTEAAAHGVDIAPYADFMQGAHKQAQLASYVSSLPQGDQAAATLAPDDFIKNQIATRYPKVENVPDGGSLFSIDQRTGQGTPIVQGQHRPPDGYQYGSNGGLTFIPGGPADPKTITGRTSAEYAGHPDPNETTARIKATLAAKIQQGGVQSLTPNEKYLWDKLTQNPFANLSDLMGGGGLGGVPAPAAPGAGGLPRPRTPQEAAALGRGAKFIGPNGDVRTVK